MMPLPSLSRCPLRPPRVPCVFVDTESPLCALAAVSPGPGCPFNPGPQAAGICEAVLRQCPTSVGPLHTLGLTLEMMGRTAEAGVALHKAAVMSGSPDPGVWTKVARLHHAAGAYDKELKALKRACSLRPHDPSLLAASAECYGAMALPKHEMRALDKLIAACAPAPHGGEDADADPSAGIVASVGECVNDLATPPVPGPDAIATGNAGIAAPTLRALLVRATHRQYTLRKSAKKRAALVERVAGALRGIDGGALPLSLLLLYGVSCAALDRKAVAAACLSRADEVRAGAAAGLPFAAQLCPEVERGLGSLSGGGPTAGPRKRAGPSLLPLGVDDVTSSRRGKRRRADPSGALPRPTALQAAAAFAHGECGERVPPPLHSMRSA